MDEEPVLLHKPNLMLAIIRGARLGRPSPGYAMARLLANLATAHELAPAQRSDLDC